MLIKSQTWDAVPTLHAMNILRYYSPRIETPEHRAWVMDQVLRALTNCPVILRTVTPHRGEVLEVETLGESAEYVNFINEHPNWDKGVPP